MDRLISVLVAIYNVEAYLRLCIESIINQTYKDLEIILVDDGSTDSSGNICDEYACRDERIRVHHTENGGLSSARNVGLRVAMGDYILMVDGDDALHPQMIEILHGLITSGDYDFSMCYGEQIHDTSQIEAKQAEKIDTSEVVELTRDTYLRNLCVGDSLLKVQYVVTWNKLFKKELLMELYFKELPCQDVFQDFEYNTRVGLKMTKGILLPEYLYYWIQRLRSLSHQGNYLRDVEALKSLLICLNDVPQKEIKNRAYFLRTLWRNMLSRRLWSRKTEFYAVAIENSKYIKQQTSKELWENPYIPVLEKLGLSLFYYCPPPILSPNHENNGFRGSNMRTYILRLHQSGDIV